MPPAHLREARQEDARAIARVHVDSWRSTYRGIVPEGFLAEMSYEDFEDRWREWLRNVGEPRRVYRVAELPSGRIVGFATGGPRHGPPYPDYAGELYTLYLLREHRRAGIGNACLARWHADWPKEGCTPSWHGCWPATLRGASTKLWAWICSEAKR